MASPKIEDDELPAGVDSTAQAASNAMPEQKAEVEQTDLPKDVPTETDDADRVVTTSDVKKPVEEEKVKAVETKAAMKPRMRPRTARGKRSKTRPRPRRPRRPIAVSARTS